jgi:3D (Asp-Asp-Asp) domain-containing protein
MTNAIGCEASAGGNSDGSGPKAAGDPGSVDPVRRGVLGTVGALIRSGGVLLAELIDRMVDRFVQGIRGVASIVVPLAIPLVVGVSCQSTSDVAKVAPPVHEVAPAPPQAPKQTGPRQLGEFTITFYYVIGEDEVAAKKPVLVAANDNRTGENRNGNDSKVDESETELASITPDLVTLYAGGSCEPIAEVSKEFASQIALQGTGKLHDGRVVNIFGACNCHRSPCFKVTRAQWGTSGSGRPLQPFRTIAVDPKVVKLGSLLYVPLLEGRTMPGRQPWGGYVHDGCVVADDTGGHIAGNRIDLFVGRKAYFVGLGRSGSGGSHAWARHVPVFDGTGICERKGRVVSRKSASI